MPSFASRSNFPKISSPLSVHHPPRIRAFRLRLPLRLCLRRGRERASPRFEPSFQPSFPTLTGDTGSSLLPLPSCSRTPRNLESLSSSAARISSSWTLVSCVPPYATRTTRGARRRGDGRETMERVTRETREENGGKGRRTKGASSNRKLPKYFTS